MQRTPYKANSTDAELVCGCHQQDRLAQRYLYQRYYGKMLGICMRYTSQKVEAEDVLNQAFLKIFKNINEYKEQGNLHGWMATIVLRTAIDYVRSKVKYRQVMDFNNNTEPELNAEIIDQLYAEDLYKLIQKLPANTRAVFSLYVVEGYKHREIAEILEVNINTSKWHLAEGKKLLRKWVEKIEKPTYNNRLKLAYFSKLFF